MSWKKFFMGEKMPDRDDPRYRKRYEREVNAGRHIAEKLHLDVPFCRAQRFADRYPAAFLTIVFGFVFICFCLNVYRMVDTYHHRTGRHVTATELQEQRLHHLKDSLIMRKVITE